MRDTTLSGVFAAIGKYMLRNYNNSAFEVEQFNSVVNLFIKRIEQNKLNLDKFYENYEFVSGRSINIGKYVRNVIAFYIQAIIPDENIEWEQAFNIEMGE